MANKEFVDGALNPIIDGRKGDRFLDPEHDVATDFVLNQIIHCLQPNVDAPYSFKRMNDFSHRHTILIKSMNVLCTYSSLTQA